MALIGLNTPDTFQREHTLGDVQNNATSSMTALTEFLGITSLIERENGTNEHFDLTFIDKLRERIQQFSGDLGRREKLRA